MMDNIVPILVAALIPTIFGFLYYNPKTVGGAWIKSTGKTEQELMDGFNLPLVMGLGLLLGLFLSFGLNALVELSHGSFDEAGKFTGGSNYTFGHGALHGAIIFVTIALPPFLMNALYERKTWTNTIIHLVFWLLVFACSAGLTDAWN